MGRFVKLYVHLVWNVRDREPLLDAEARDWLWPDLEGTARDLGSGYVVAGGAADHVHVLMELPPTLTVAQVVKRLKGATSRRGGIGWQASYGAFTVGWRTLPRVEQYVRDQAHHHAVGSVEGDWELPDPTRRPQHEKDSR